MHKIVLHFANIPCILLYMFKRSIRSLFSRLNFFLFGPRQVGKTTLSRDLDSIFYVDLLDPETQLAYSKTPNLLHQQIEATSCNGTIIIDEIQRVPKLLDVVQMLISNYDSLRFIMSGSSARKLRHGHANLLGGRAFSHILHPLTIDELGNLFKLDWVLGYGSLPKVYSSLVDGNYDMARDLLKSYVTTYIKEEIKSEALVRNLQGFQNFLDIAASQFAEQVNFSDIGRQCYVAYATVREYYSILEDTLIGFFLHPFSRSERKRMSLAPKFYFFDNGVTRSLLGSLGANPSLIERGRLFEQWFVQEVVRLNDYEQKDFRLSFWRTSHGAEVDLIIEKTRKILCAIEIKSSENISSADLSGLNSFLITNPSVPAYVAAPVKTARKIGNVIISTPMDVLNFLKTL